MAFIEKGFRTLDFIGSIDGAAGANTKIHGYVTNDDTAAIETANYFDAMAARVRKGDIIWCVLGINGTAMLRNYVVASVTAGVVAISPQNVA